MTHTWCMFQSYTGFYWQCSVCGKRTTDLRLTAVGPNLWNEGCPGRRFVIEERSRRLRISPISFPDPETEDRP